MPNFFETALRRAATSALLCLLAAISGGCGGQVSGDSSRASDVQDAPNTKGDGDDAGATTMGDDSTSTPSDPSGDADPSVGSEPDAIPSSSCLTDATYDSFAQDFFVQNCNICHTSAKSGKSRLGAPDGVDFDTEDEIIEQAEAIRVRVLEEKTMPVGIVLDECQLERLDTFLVSLDAPPCERACDGKSCGSDGCGSTCGSCPLGETCVAESGACEAVACVSSCNGKACGDDGCGGSCGECGDNLICSDAQQCVCAPQCDGESCGDDGCGGSCGDCLDNEACGGDGQCVCVPNCNGKVCGDDGCGGLCGSCSSSAPECAADAASCECIPDCRGKTCGDDGCGGSCGSCPGRTCNTREGRCVAMCTTDCSGRVCGEDGCEGSCGSCDGANICNSDGICACEPDCLGKACGDDGCGGDCGQCAGGSVCSAEGQCACTPNCDGKSCGSDGCGGQCGTCADGESCSGGSCSAFCAPDCSGKECGDDGCQSSCGSCGNGTSCVSGQCAWPDTSFESDAYPVLDSGGCADTGCHGGMRPAQGLDLSSASVAYDSLVAVPSSECSDRLLVNPGSPETSYLIHKVTGEQLCSGSKMPKSGAGLSSQQIETLRAWIGAGAEP